MSPAPPGGERGGVAVPWRRGGRPWLELAGLAAVLALSLALNLWRLSALSLMGDEAIYAYPARAAAVHGHWYPLLYGDHTLFYGKPPLTVWPVALSFWLNGVGEGSDRLPSALAGAALVGVVYGFAAWLLGPWTGLLAAMLLATCRPWLFAHGVREGVGDPLLCLLFMAALLLYLRHRIGGRRGWLAGAALAAALAALVKGPLAPCLLGLITLVWELLRRYVPAPAIEARGRSPWPSEACGRSPWPSQAPRRSPWLWGPAVVTIVGLAAWGLWLLDYGRRGMPLRQVVVRDVVQRTLLGVDPRHVHGAFYYAGVLRDAFGHWWAALLPAAFWLYRTLRQGGRRAPAALLLAVWPLAVLAVLHASVSKLSWYLDPALPALAILLAAGCGEAARWLARRSTLGARLLGAGLAALVAARAATAWNILRQPPSGRHQMHRFELAVRRLPGARVYLADAAERPGSMREWNYFYLSEIEDLVQPLPPPPAGIVHCAFVLADDPAAIAARFHAAAWTAVPIERRSAEEEPLSILDLCGGRVVRGLS